MLGLTFYEEDLHGSLLKPGFQACLKSSLLEVSDVADDFYLTDIIECFPPFALVQASCCKYNKVSAVLWGKLDTFLVILLNELSEIPANYILLDFNFIFTEVWNF